MTHVTFFRISKRLLSVLALGAACVLSPISIALAHTEIVSTSPAKNSDANAPQESITITFSEPPLTAGAAIVIMNEAGETLDSPAPTLAGATLSIPWPTDLTPGEVLVTWRATATDGHVLSNEFSFKYTAAAESGLAPSTLPADAGTVTPEPMMSAFGAPATTDLPLDDAEISGNNNTSTIVAIVALAGLVSVSLYLRRSK